MISVIVPVYNVQDYLKECVESILGQTFTDFEVLLIDDGSTDHSSIIADELRNCDPRIFVYHKPNGGLSDARNYGIDKAKGQFLTFIDSDDFIAPTYLGTLYSLCSNFGSEVACIRSIETTERRINISHEQKEYGVFNGIDAIKHSLLRNKIGVSACGKLFQSTLFKDIRFPRGELYEDFLTIPYIFEKCSKVAYSDSTLYYYYQRPGSITNSRITEAHMRYFENVNQFEEHFHQYGKEMHDAIVVRVAGESINRFAEILLFCSDYNEKVEKVRSAMRDYWEEALSNPLVPFSTKMQVFTLQRGSWLYRLVFKPYKILKNIIKRKTIK